MIKSRAILTILMVGFGLSTSICIAQTVDKTTGHPQKKEQHVKIFIKKDGKLIEKDTTFITNDGKGVIFSDKNTIYNGDSIIIAKDSKGMEQTVTVIVNDEMGSRSKSGKTGTYTNTYTFTSKDTVQKNVTRKMVRTEDGKQIIVMQNGEGDASDLPASPPTVKGYRIMGHPLSDPFAFNPADTSIVSYNKKDMGKGLEKITIIRKKSVQTK